MQRFVRARRAAAAIALVGIGCGVLATAWSVAPGETLYREGRTDLPACATCHGAGGEGGADGLYPRLAQLPAAYAERQLRDFRDGRRSDPVMTAMAATLTDADVGALASFVSTLPSARAAVSAPDAAQARVGQSLVTIGAWERGVAPCAGCHGPALTGVAPAIPGLAGQWPGYLAKQLAAFRDGARPATPLGLMSRVAHGMTAGEIDAVSAYLGSLRSGDVPAPPRPATPVAWTPVPQLPDSFVPPPDDAIPAGPYGDLVRLGQAIFEDTATHAGQYSRNDLSCRNCHLDRGRSPVSGPMWAAYVHYPEYRKKDGLVNTLQMRIQGCFRYSQNGVVPAADSREITALVTYLHWLATGLPTGIKPKAVGYPRLAAPAQPPSPARGAQVYASRCALCHGDDGQGRLSGDRRAFPPLWGPRSYNWGAGMHQVDMAAAFIRANMPYGAGGMLTEQEAWDVAAFVNSRPRPQDPRFTVSTEQTRGQFHAGHAFEFYGQTVDGVLLGGDAPEPAR